VVLLSLTEILFSVIFPCFPRAAEITEPGPGVPPIAGPAQPAKQNGMGGRDWQPFVYGGLASCTAEFGMCVITSSVFIFFVYLMEQPECSTKS